MDFYYKMYKKYCAQLHLTPVEYKDFHIALYHHVKILVHSQYGFFKHTK